MLLIADAVTTARRLFRWIAGVSVVWLLVILISAAKRLRLYMDALGLTVDRVPAAAVMTPVAAVLVLLVPPRATAQLAL